MRIRSFAYLLVLLLISSTSIAQTPTPTPAAKQRHYTDSPWYRAKTALSKGDTKTASRLAQELLDKNKDASAWHFGNTVHDANQILGLAALKEGRVRDAKHYLIAAGKSPGSPQLDSFGPSMKLAQALLAKGERNTVILYLDLVADFWAYTSPEDLKKYEAKKKGMGTLIKNLNTDHQRQIDKWKAEIRAGKQPQLQDSY